MRTVQEILSALRSHRSRLFDDYPIKSLAIFGSYVRAEETPSSDIDILVEFSGRIGVRFIDLADELERIIGFKVDLVSRNGIKEKYFKCIESELCYV